MDGGGSGGSELQRFNSWREEEGLDAADALGADTTSVLPSASLSTTSADNLLLLAKRRQLSGAFNEEEEEDSDDDDGSKSSVSREPQEEEEAPPSPPILTAPAPPPLPRNSSLLGQDSDDELMMLRLDSQSHDCVADGLDAADARGSEGLLEELSPAHVPSPVPTMPSSFSLPFGITASLTKDDTDSSPIATFPSILYPTYGNTAPGLVPHQTNLFTAATTDPENGDTEVVVDPDSDGEDEELIPDNGLLESQRTAMPQTHHSRFVPRDAVFDQSSVHLNVKNRVENHDRATYWSYFYLMYQDWFDFLLSLKTWRILAILWAGYTAQMVLFACFYLAASNDCDTTEALGFAQSFAFSLEISTTVGYTLPQGNNVMFFNGCGSWVAIVYLQCLVSIVLNGVILGTIMLRFSRADRRAVQVVYSNKACITCIQGRFYFTFQCFDLQAANSMITSTVRVFAIFHELKPDQPGALWQTRVMRLIRPNDELGAKLWLSTPCVVMHEIDAWSPLAPSLLSRPPKTPMGTAANRFPQTPQRSADGRQGSRAQCTCVVCGSMFLTESALRRHIAYCAEKEEHDKATRQRHHYHHHEHSTAPAATDAEAERPSHIGLDPRKMTRPVVTRNAAPGQTQFLTVTPEATRDAISERFKRRNIEVVCLIEGTDTITANSFQARHSYCSQDIEYDSQHSPCVFLGWDGGPEVNLSRFHKTWKGESNFEEAIAYPSFT